MDITFTTPDIKKWIKIETDSKTYTTNLHDYGKTTMIRAGYSCFDLKDESELRSLEDYLKNNNYKLENYYDKLGDTFGSDVKSFSEKVEDVLKEMEVK